MKNPTKEQQKMILSEARVISLKASGGTGKTETIAWYVMANREIFNGMVLVTYTNSAADTTEQRLGKFYDESMFIGTIHKFAYPILKEHADLIGFKELKLEPGITDKMIQRIVKDNKNRLKYLNNPFKILKAINEKYLRSNKIIEGIARQYVDGEKHIKSIREMILGIKPLKKKMDVMDYDDLPYYFYILLKNNQSLIKTIVKKYPLMVIDEFQDTSLIQWKIMKLLIEGGIYFVGAGDPFQTLYRFAGASFDIFDKLEKLHKCKSFQLTQNHRSTKQIVELSNAIRSQIKYYKEQENWSNKNGSKPQVFLDPQIEMLAKAILRKITWHITNNKMSLNDMAVIFRFNSDAKYLMKKLKKEKIPFVFFGDNEKSTSEFYEFAMSIFKISKDHGLRKDWENILPFLKGMGDKNKKDALKLLEKEDYWYHDIDKFQGNINYDLTRLKCLIQDVISLSDDPHNAIQEIVKFYTSLGKTKKITNDPALATMLNIAKKSKNNIDFILNCLDLSFGKYYSFNNQNEHLTLSTIHKIKSKGFKVVFVLGTYDQRFSRFGTFENEDTITEEIMLMDTAVSRSKRFLYLLFPMAYKDWKQKKHKNNPSIFIRNCHMGLYDVFTVKADE